MNKTARFFIRRTIGFISFAIGTYLMVAYMNKVLPFGIRTSNIGVNGVWAYLGWFIAIALIAYGIVMIFNRTYNKLMRKLHNREI